jgi:hypothetical protein
MQKLLELLATLSAKPGWQITCGLLAGALIVYQYVALPWRKDRDAAQAKLDVWVEMARAALQRKGRRRGDEDSDG